MRKLPLFCLKTQQCSGKQVEANAEELAQIECLELGKPIEEARGGVAISLLTYRYYGETPHNNLQRFPTISTS